MGKRLVRSRGFDPGPRRLSAWDLGPGGDDLTTWDRTSFSSSAVKILGSGVLPFAERLTIIRTRGFLEFELTSASAAAEGFNFVAGIGIVTADAFAVGVTAIPSPFDDINWPGWLWIQGMSMVTVHGALAIGDPSDNPVRLDIDSKAQRILRQNEVAFLAVQGGETGTAVAAVRGYTRMLVKLS